MPRYFTKYYGELEVSQDLAPTHKLVERKNTYEENM